MTTSAPRFESAPEFLLAGIRRQHTFSEVASGMPASGYEDAHIPPFELYDERFNPETGEGGFEIWFPVRRRGEAEQP